MSDDEWGEENFGPAAPVGPTDKWEGEDEDEDDVKDCWDADSDEEKSKSEKSEAAPKAAAGAAAEQKKKKKLRDRIALLEAQANEDVEDESTPEEKLAEKLRLQKLEEANQLALTRDMLGLKTGPIDAMIPSTREEFEAFQKALREKICFFSSSEHFPDLLEGIVKDLSLEMSLPTLKKVKIHVEGVHATRLKEEKATKSKKKGGGRSSLKNDLDKDLFSSGGGAEQFDDMDDFM